VRKTLVALLDVSLCIAAVWAGFLLRLGELRVGTRPALIFAAIAVVAWLFSTQAMRTYRSVVRYSGGHTLANLARTCALLSAILIVVVLWFPINGVPRTLAVIQPVLLFLFLSVERIFLSQLILGSMSRRPRETKRKRILIYGAGSAGQQLAASMRFEPGLVIVGFIDANQALRKRLLDGKLIWHSSDLEHVLSSHEIDEVFLAIPSARRSKRRAIVERIRQCDGRVKVRILPTLSQIASGRVSISDLREVRIEELLGRDEVPPDPSLICKNITGRVVLVTGAGGSIGSELCRQIVRLHPSRLILAEQSEHALYRIDGELRALMTRQNLQCELVPELANVAAETQCSELFNRWAPETVFHAAAYKHVPLVEMNPLAGVRNNVFGTLHACLAAEAAGTRNFILISTDKAVRPTNVMGASKRICELIIQARAKEQEATKYTSVRFGNVLGSSGSVIPKFREQIAAGGPVTITHRDATRYFMTIPEASQLVIQAGALAHDGEVLLLDMGKPVKIMDLARAMIELSGLSVVDDSNPDGDIVIEEIGLRPGEKLVEELLIGEDSEPTAHPRIIKAREKMLEWRDLRQKLTELERHLEQSDVASVIGNVKQLVPEYVTSAGQGNGARTESAQLLQLRRMKRLA
jgi:FlaA1/EpsC-like NDP-sugar epimerase